MLLIGNLNKTQQTKMLIIYIGCSVNMRQKFKREFKGLYPALFVILRIFVLWQFKKKPLFQKSHKIFRQQTCITHFGFDFYSVQFYFNNCMFCKSYVENCKIDCTKFIIYHEPLYERRDDWPYISYTWAGCGNADQL